MSFCFPANSNWKLFVKTKNTLCFSHEQIAALELVGSEGEGTCPLAGNNLHLSFSWSPSKEEQRRVVQPRRHCCSETGVFISRLQHNQGNVQGCSPREVGSRGMLRRILFFSLLHLWLPRDIYQHVQSKAPVVLSKMLPKAV